MKIIFGFATVLLAASLTVAGVVQAQQSSKLPPAAGSVKMTSNAENKTRKDAAPKAVSPVPAPESAETSEQFLFEYLLSELANQRGETAIAESGLLGLSKRFGDPRLARRATEVALQSGQMEQAYEAIILWLEVEPHSPMARQILARMAGSDLASSKTSLSKWLGVSKTPVVITRATPVIFMQLPVILARFIDKNAEKSTEKSAEKNAEKSGDKNNYIQTVRELAKPFPRLAEAHHAVAQAELIGGNNAYALAAIDEAIQLKSGWSQAAILKSQILRGAKSESAEQNALDFLQGFLTANPAASDARLIYARLLAAQKSYLSSREEFRKIDQDNVNKKINDPESSYAIALISQQMEDYAEAEKQFLRTLDAKPYDSNPVYFNLGVVTEAQKNNDVAIGWFRRVGEGEYFVNAKLKAASLIAKRDGLPAGRKYLQDAQMAADNVVVLAESGQTQTSLQNPLQTPFQTPISQRIRLILAEAELLRNAPALEQAFQLLDNAVTQNPNSVELIYDRAMIAEKLDKLALFEADMRRVMVLKPDYAQAYNALGYTLAERNQRLDESYQLIQRAISLAPDDPFIQDSLGWVQFRLGRIDEALVTLQKVYKVRRDPEIAAHLGEVLWAAGQRAAAQTLLREAIKENPGHIALVGLIEKYTQK